jgi:hypothetical protein
MFGTMQGDTKITISDHELQVVTDRSWILVKRGVIEKAVLLFAGVAPVLKGILEGHKDILPDEVLASTPRISKGESYRMLPYVVMDYPRSFARGNIFAVRTMFWWGNFFSCTILLEGSYKKLFSGSLKKNIPALKGQGLYLCVHSDPWQHHFGADNYIELETLDPEAVPGILDERPFIKIAVKYPLQQWNEMPLLLEGAFVGLLKLLEH